MRRSKLGALRRLIAAAIAVFCSLVAAGCTLVQPGCRNRDVKASIEQDARESLGLSRSMSGLAAAIPSNTEVALVDQVEVARHDNTRSCTANVAVGVDSKAVSVPIEYEVTAGADGEAFYQWDKYGFGKKLIGTELMSVLQSMAQTKQGPPQDDGTAPRPEAQPEATPAPETPQTTIPSPEAGTAPSDVMEAWKTQVRSEIAARAEKLTDMPEGRQHMRFRIGPDGEITMAKAVEPIANPVLADRLVKFLEESDRVTKPPLNRVTWIDVTFSF